MPDINYPGNICMGIYRAIGTSPQAFMIGWHILFGLFLSYFLYTTLFAFRRSAVRAETQSASWLLSPAFFIFLICAAVFILRIPNLVVREQDVDESQWIATAASYFHGAILWKTVTGGTGGPLIYMLPTIMIPLDGMSYATIHLFGLLFCVIPTIYIAWLTVRMLIW